MHTTLSLVRCDDVCFLFMVIFLKKSLQRSKRSWILQNAIEKEEAQENQLSPKNPMENKGLFWEKAKVFIQRLKAWRRRQKLFGGAKILNRFEAIFQNFKVQGCFQKFWIAILHVWKPLPQILRFGVHPVKIIQTFETPYTYFWLI